MSYNVSYTIRSILKEVCTIMNIGDKIHALRLQQDLTLEEVGNIVGVGKSTVRKWETGQISNMRRDKIAKLAKALHTTPAYLMEWTDNPDPQFFNTCSPFTFEETELIRKYRCLDDRGRSNVRAVLDNEYNLSSPQT